MAEREGGWIVICGSTQPPSSQSTTASPPQTIMTMEECAPPPRFHLPPPPRPPYLPGVAPACPFHSCSIRPVIDAEYHSSPALPSLLSISIGSALVLLTLLVFTALVCKHQKKMRNFLPCKTLPQSHCDISHQNGGVIYEDMTNIHPRNLPQAPIEMLDVKRTKTWLGVGGYANPGSFPVLRQPPVFICPPPLPQHHQYSQDLYNPVYEELSNCSESKRGESEGTSDLSQRGHYSEDDFAEDESSVTGFPMRTQTQPRQMRGSMDHKSTTNSEYRSLTGRRSPLSGSRSTKQGPNMKQIRSFDRRRCKPSHQEPAFHEGLLLDALFQFYPNRSAHHQFPCILPLSHSPPHYDRLVKKVSTPDQTSVRQCNDSDSGYSHNTSEGHGSTVKGRKGSRYIPDSPSLLL